MLMLGPLMTEIFIELLQDELRARGGGVVVDGFGVGERLVDGHPHLIHSFQGVEVAGEGTPCGVELFRVAEDEDDKSVARERGAVFGEHGRASARRDDDARPPRALGDGEALLLAEVARREPTVVLPEEGMPMSTMFVSSAVTSRHTFRISAPTSLAGEGSE